MVKKKMVAYEPEQMQRVVNLLDTIQIKGIASAKAIAEIWNILDSNINVTVDIEQK